MDRKDFFSDGWKQILGDLSRTPVGSIIDRQFQSVSNILSPEWMEYHDFDDHTADPRISPENFPRPPGAVFDNNEFQKKCTSCGDCIVACPHGVLFTVPGIYGPVLDPNLNACRLCPEYPCIHSCETKALKKLRKNHLPWFGRAELKEGLCKNLPGRIDPEKICKACTMGCPVEEAVVLSESSLPEFADHCTGCGMCALVCPESAIRINLEE
ncbi:MAG: 4Fe-4S binding protein [Spirochaetia bacterium]|nr:4Fe-4S binding protein [Spirochaetia bacterium]